GGGGGGGGGSPTEAGGLCACFGNAYLCRAGDGRGLDPVAVTVGRHPSMLCARGGRGGPTEAGGLCACFGNAYLCRAGDGRGLDRCCCHCWASSKHALCARGLSRSNVLVSRGVQLPAHVCVKRCTRHYQVTGSCDLGH